jgi:hypothetical protein
LRQEFRVLGFIKVSRFFLFYGGILRRKFSGKSFGQRGFSWNLSASEVSPGIFRPAKIPESSQNSKFEHRPSREEHTRAIICSNNGAHAIALFLSSLRMEGMAPQ